MIGLVAGTVLAIVSVFLIVLTGAISCNGLFGNINIRYILLMLGGFFWQGAMEEVLCRGIALRLLLKRVSAFVAIGISSALFIIPHLSKMTGSSGVVIVFAILNTLMISIILSIFTIYYRSIWAACGLHTIWNFVLYNVFGMNLSGNDQMTASVFDMRSVGSNILNGGIYGIEAGVVTAIVLAVTIVIMIIILNRKGGMTDGIE